MAEKAEKPGALAQYADALSPRQRLEQRERAFTAFNTQYAKLTEKKNSPAGFSRIAPTNHAAECFVRYLDLVKLRGMQHGDPNKKLTIQTGFEFVRAALVDPVCLLSMIEKYGGAHMMFRSQLAAYASSGHRECLSRESGAHQQSLMTRRSSRSASNQPHIWKKW